MSLNLRKYAFNMNCFHVVKMGLLKLIFCRNIFLSFWSTADCAQTLSLWSLHCSYRWPGWWGHSSGIRVPPEPLIVVLSSMRNNSLWTRLLDLYYVVISVWRYVSVLSLSGSIFISRLRKRKSHQKPGRWNDLKCGADCCFHCIAVRLSSLFSMFCTAVEKEVADAAIFILHGVGDATFFASFLSRHQE